MVDGAPPIDPTVWRASSPSSVKIPAVGSRVYYFPQGHAEQCSYDPDFADVRISKSCYLLQVVGIRYLADVETDEAFVRISLAPPSPHDPTPSNPNPPPAEELKSAKAHTKMLTQSDSNNGGGFSVLKACALSIFPPLDYTETDTPVQILQMSDLLGKPWTFRHIYRGNPRRHLLTTGWSKFVDAKRIVSGDSIVFIRKDGELFVGIRRRHHRVAVPEDVESAKNTVGFVRDRRGRVAPDAVVEAVRAAEGGRPFDVDFYPGKGTPEVVVDAGTVSKAAAAGPAAYAVGATVRAKVTTDDAKSGGTWRLGTVTAVSDYDRSPWPGSPWRMLQVKWKEQELNPDRRGVSPWEVEPIPTMVRIHSPHAVAKIPSPRLQSDSIATVATKVVEICDRPVGMDATKGDLTMPPCDDNGTLPVGARGPDQGPSVGTVAAREGPSPPADVPQRQGTTDSGNEAQGPNVATISDREGIAQGPNVAIVSSNREGPPPLATCDDGTQCQGTTDSGNVPRRQVQLFGVTIVSPLGVSDEDGDADTNRDVGDDETRTYDANTTTT